MAQKVGPKKRVCQRDNTPRHVGYVDRRTYDGCVSACQASNEKCS